MKSIAFLFFLFCTVNVIAQTSEDFESNIITSSNIVASSFISDDEGWLSDNTGHIWHTSDSGQTWDELASEKYFLEMDFVTSLKGYATTADAAFKTSDGGVTWSTLTLPGNAPKCLLFLDENTGFIGSNEAIYKTTNGGSTWSTASIEGVVIVDFYFTSSNTGIAAGIDGNNYQCIWRTTNGGTSWGNVFSSEKFFINSVWFVNENTGWAAGYYAETGRGKLPLILQTEDGGTTWETAFINRHPGDIIGEELLDIRFKNELEGFATSTYSESMITSDGGATWNLTYDDEGVELVPSYGIYKNLDGYSEMYLSGRNGYVTTWK